MEAEPAGADMDICKILVQLWAALSLVSLAIDAACLWLDQHAAMLSLGTYGINLTTVFMASAPMPIILAVVLPVLGALFAALHRLGGIAIRSLARAHRPARPPGHRRA